MNSSQMKARQVVEQLLESPPRIDQNSTPEVCAARCKLRAGGSALKRKALKRKILDASSGAYKVEIDDDSDEGLSIITLYYDGSIGSPDAENSAEFTSEYAGLTRNNVDPEVADFQVTENDDDDGGHVVQFYVDRIK
jgi:hypothetical protein